MKFELVTEINLYKEDVYATAGAITVIAIAFFVSMVVIA